MFTTIVYPGFWKKCYKCKEWKEDIYYNNQRRNHSKDKKETYCKTCTSELRKKYYRDNLVSNRLKGKRRNLKYLRHKDPVLDEIHRIKGSQGKLLQRLYQRKARGELVIRLVSQVWEIEAKLLQGRIIESTPEEIREARAVVITLFRRLTHFHPDAIADKFDICTHDVARHGMIMREYTNINHGNIIVVQKIAKVRRLYGEQKDGVNNQAKLSSKYLPGFDTYTQAELKDWKAPIEKLEYPNGIDTESLARGVCWFMGTDYNLLHTDIRRGILGSVRTRQVLSYILRKYEGWTYEQITSYFNKDHSTCHHNVAAGVRILGLERESLIYELNRVWAAKQRLVVLLSYMGVTNGKTDPQFIRESLYSVR